MSTTFEAIHDIRDDQSFRVLRQQELDGADAADTRLAIEEALAVGETVELLTDMNTGRIQRLMIGEVPYFDHLEVVEA